MPDLEQPHHVTVLARIASVVWVAWFLTIAIGDHWGTDATVLFVATIVATVIAIGAQVQVDTTTVTCQPRLVPCQATSWVSLIGTSATVAVESRPNVMGHLVARIMPDLQRVQRRWWASL